MILRWWRTRRRTRLLAAPFPEAWSRHLEEHVPFYLTLTPPERRQLEGIARVIVEEKRWEGCAGLVLTDEMRVNVAAQASLLILNLEHDYYHHVRSIFMYPSTFVLPAARADHGFVREGRLPVVGLAHHRGPIVLAWDEARHGAYNPVDGRNVVFHEFAHKLDMLDDYADGTPVLDTPEHYRTWVRIMTEEYDALVTASEKRRATLLDAYGAEYPAEFFAVATECFFEKPKSMRRRHPELYVLLRDYFRQDPAARA